MKEMTIGQYYPTTSFIHALDARTKIMATLLYIIFIFTVNNMLGYLLGLLFLVIVIACSKVPVGYVLRGLKPVAFIVVLTVLINLFWTTGEILWQWWIFKITIEGLQLAVKMGLRLMLLVSTTSMMTLTTSTMDLTDGMEALMKKVPFMKKAAHEVSMMMSIALRFIPTLTEEADRIMKAQKSRGADFDSGNVVQKAKALLPILVPLFVSAFQRANELAMAMEARCYSGGENRTKLKELKYTSKDAFAYVFILFYYAAMFASRYVPLAW